MALKIEKNRDVSEVIQELSTTNKRIESLLEKLPTNDTRILSELDMLFNNLPRILNEKTTAEKSTMLYEQAVGKSMSLKERYHYKLTHGGLRKAPSAPKIKPH